MSKKTSKLKKKFDNHTGNPNETLNKNNRNLINEVNPQITTTKMSLSWVGNEGEGPFESAPHIFK